MMQAASDIFLGYTQDEDSGRQFYVRTLKNRRLGGVSEISEVQALSDYARYAAVRLRVPMRGRAIPPQLPAIWARAKHR